MDQGEFLFKQRDDAEAIYFVESGEILVTGKVNVVHKSRSGNFKVCCV